ncbi:hypothetical protein MFRU_009g03200 [Monilinia fructicola]|uniref:Branched-chain-amino-acid aminotransferase n=1 Tax=Monilinia fructicola TaxID=38448 RepID=A0A5M9KC26_MONFR|nr:hypothetical protein EYC84_006589 [Monilinia fructicola]KAG4031558.1 hypothetical protein MFRU_009g03200 [Monilinia fructicola]
MVSLPSPHTMGSDRRQSTGLNASRVLITRTTTPRSVPEPNSKEVWASKNCTDHMVTVRWTADEGWQTPEIRPYGPLTMMPTASCLHYATQCFEGMKVYRGFDGKLRLFRPDRNCKRLVLSAQRVVLPAFDPEELEKLILTFMAVDGPRWLPKSRPGTFLYVRPAIIGDGEELGVTSPSAALLFVIAVPWPDLSGTPPGADPKPPGLRLLASKEDTRAWPGGFGYAKVGANYGPAFVSHMEGRKLGYDQILWLFGPDYQVTEAGASNFFLILRNAQTKNLELLTAPLTGKLILDGVTRRSVLDLAAERLAATSTSLPPNTEPLEIVERSYTMLEIEEAQKEGRVVEAFLSGTAYFITPVSTISFRDRDIPIPMQEDSGLYTKMIKTWLYDIMYGNVEHEWGVIVDEDEK